RGREVYPTEGSCRFPLIVLQQTTQSFLATHNSVLPARSSIRQWEQEPVLLALVIALRVVMCHVLLQGSAQRVLPEQDEFRQAFLFHRSHPAFCKGVPSLQLPAAQAPVGPAASSGPRLTLAEAERMAIEHNPNISVARLIALAQAQVMRDVRSGELPTATGSLTAVGAHENSRVTAGLLNNPSIYDRAAGGLTVSQLITDFGRSHNLVRSAQSNAKAQLENERATELD